MALGVDDDDELAEWLELDEALLLGVPLELCVVEGEFDDDGELDGVPEADCELLWLVEGVEL